MTWYDFFLWHGRPVCNWKFLRRLYVKTLNVSQEEADRIAAKEHLLYQPSIVTMKDEGAQPIDDLRGAWFYWLPGLSDKEYLDEIEIDRKWRQTLREKFGVEVAG